MTAGVTRWSRGSKLSVAILAGAAMLTPALAQKAQKETRASDPASVLAVTAPAPPRTTIVEQIVARVNDSIITTTDFDQAVSDLTGSLQQQAQQSGKTVTAAEIATDKKNLLSHLIDNQLLEQRAKALGMSAETETVLALDQLRKQNHLATMEDLQKAVESQGESYEDFKQNIKNEILQKKVIEEDVAPRVAQPTPQQVAKYYDAHKKDFVQQDAVGLSEILIQTEGKPEAEQARLKSLADQVQQRASNGEDFAKLAQRYSNAPSAPQGGDIGFEQRKDLDPALSKVLFDLPMGGVTPVEKISSGYLILKVTGIHHAGQETLAEASSQINNILYQQALRPEMNTYLAKLRREAYIVVKPGYVDTGANAGSGVDLEKFQRVLPSDLPKPTDKDRQKSAGGFSSGGQ